MFYFQLFLYVFPVDNQVVNHCDKMNSLELLTEAIANLQIKDDILAGKAWYY